MAHYNTVSTSLTTAAIAEGAQVTANNYHAIRSAAAQDWVALEGIDIQGESQTNPTTLTMCLRRHTTNATAPTNLIPTAVNPNQLASIFQMFNTVVTTQPTTAAIATVRHLRNMSLNAFGGIYVWQPYNDNARFIIFATAANFGEVSISALTGAGIISCNVACEE